ncbi:actin binding protein [Heterostelium album PN500]|uniref:Coronin n=1 Tax=Heterostelium pallidum (strain ATCC 26659 / Pp 5 / PN500) TaxID=670386 RepID=D3B210_HETP5|nr:actin binding protein [Heterostelium album PN500]EFA85334.1 actin binding protein [Heterostelium album PN500]|eukprot:XP_020437443.1 actin binding protein [Heterostelium album PN500]
MSKVVRSSKYRHVFGQAAKKEETYQNLKVTKSAWDSNYIAANSKYLAVIWESGGGGSFAVLGHDQLGKLDQANIPLFSGHKNAVLDLAFHPFNENLIASVSEDCNVMVWGIPDTLAAVHEPLQTLSGHKRKVGTAQFNPVANNVLATSSGDFAVKTWDIEAGSVLNSLDASHTDIILSVEWNANGSQLVSTCKDKKVRLFDPRSNTISHEALSHQGIKGTRGIFLRDTVLTCGFSKTSEREFKIFDPRTFAEPLTTVTIDSASGLLMPFFDPDNSILYMAGKGDGNIRYYEMVNEAPYHYYLSEFKSATPQRGICFIPKRAVNVSECEIARALKVTPTTVEPISFRVPRKSDIFQDDLYPDTYAGEPVLDAAAWAGGANAEPKTCSLAPGFTQKKVVQDFKPVAQAPTGPKTEKELRDEYEKLKTRVAYLESEIVKKDAKIKELESK